MAAGLGSGEPVGGTPRTRRMGKTLDGTDLATFDIDVTALGKPVCERGAAAGAMRKHNIARQLSAATTDERPRESIQITSTNGAREERRTLKAQRSYSTTQSTPVSNN